MKMPWSFLYVKLSKVISRTWLCFFPLLHQHYLNNSKCWHNPFLFSQICYFFYKNVTFGFTIFFYEIYGSFSGQSAYNDWYLSLYNVFFTSLPVIALGVFDQDVSAKLCLKVSLMLISLVFQLFRSFFFRPKR